MLTLSPWAVTLCVMLHSPPLLVSCVTAASACSSGIFLHLSSIKTTVFFRWYPFVHFSLVSILIHFLAAHDVAHILGCFLPQFFMLLQPPHRDHCLGISSIVGDGRNHIPPSLQREFFLIAYVHSCPSRRESNYLSVCLFPQSFCLTLFGADFLPC